MRPQLLALARTSKLQTTLETTLIFFAADVNGFQWTHCMEQQQDTNSNWSGSGVCSTRHNRRARPGAAAAAAAAAVAAAAAAAAVTSEQLQRRRQQSQRQQQQQESQQLKQDSRNDVLCSKRLKANLTSSATRCHLVAVAVGLRFLYEQP
jgi:hypothetical protein